MKLTFKMTGEEYYSGIKFKLKSDRLKKILLMILIICIFIVITIFLRLGLMMYVLTTVMIVMVCSLTAFEKKAAISQFYSSPVKSSEHTLCVYDEGIELINSYEKIFAPWQSVYAVRETEENIIILPSYARGIAVISKKRYFGPELSNIMNAIKLHVKVEEGK
ncbi:MAG: YcxB family protein [Eubacterium sp.]|nr:YcxB family protein [Eubacterium sp.]MDE6155888.1 YcxB family protein [Eubacterium sp.]MDE6767271.1 YcxB family protein [Eubacterium sp.]